MGRPKPSVELASLQQLYSIQRAWAIQPADSNATLQVAEPRSAKAILFLQVLDPHLEALILCLQVLDPHPEEAFAFFAFALARVLAILALALVFAAFFAPSLSSSSSVTRRCDARALIIQLASGPYKSLKGLIKLLRPYKAVKGPYEGLIRHSRRRNE